MLKILRVLLFAARIELENIRRLTPIKTKTTEGCEAYWPIVSLSLGKGKNISKSKSKAQLSNMK